jgi:uncharacterized membrane protein
MRGRPATYVAPEPQQECADPAESPSGIVSKQSPVVAAKPQQPQQRPSATALPLSLQEALAAAARIQVGGKIDWRELADELGCSLTAAQQRVSRLRPMGLSRSTALATAARQRSHQTAS